MGLKVTKSLGVLTNKKLVGIRFNHGNEYTLTLEDKKGKRKRIRIPSSFKQFLEAFNEQS
jgi:hypothetical protein